METIIDRMKQMESDAWGHKLTTLGQWVLRYGLVVILFWVGALKFTAYEAEGIQPLVANSPFMSWAYHVMSVRQFAGLLGIIEITLGVMIAFRAIAPLVSAIGSLGAIFMFLTTLSFVFTTPGVWQPDYGFPFPSPMPGQFLAKDILLLGAAIWAAGEAILAVRTNSVRP